MAEDGEKNGDEAGRRGIQARIFLLTMLLLFAGTVALLIYAFITYDGALS
ncbi:MAG: hypothetical protein R3174_06355 [Gammaproteobacteria bacterium]|nr:hypothetical protein [Gammaproteobacteria bacterium]